MDGEWALAISYRIASIYTYETQHSPKLQANSLKSVHVNSKL